MKHTSAEGVTLTISIVNRRKLRSHTENNKPIFQPKISICEVVEEDELNTCTDSLCETLIQNGPNAKNEAKKLIEEVSRGKIDDKMIEKTAEWIARLRASDEGKEGLSSFLEKRKPQWIKGQ